MRLFGMTEPAASQTVADALTQRLLRATIKAVRQPIAPIIVKANDNTPSSVQHAMTVTAFILGRPRPVSRTPTGAHGPARQSPTSLLAIWSTTSA